MCVHTLRTSFLGSTVTAGGAWTYVGFNETSKTGPFTSNATVPPTALVGAIPIALTGDNPSVDWASKDDGYYYFTYDVSGLGCGGSVGLIVHTKESCFNSTVTLNVHNEQGPIHLNDFVVEGLGCDLPDGYWTYTSGLVSAFDGINGIFYPALTTTGTTHTMEYIVARNCSDCKSSVTINIYDCSNNNLCYYFTDFSETQEQSNLDSSEILSFKVGGIEQLTTPVVGLGVKNVITYGSNPYLTNFVDSLNALNIDCFQFYYAAITVGAETRQKFARFCVPQNIDWEIKVKCSGGTGSNTYWIYNQAGVTWSYDDITYNDMMTSGFYNIAPAVTDGIEFCKTTSACE